MAWHGMANGMFDGNGVSCTEDCIRVSHTLQITVFHVRKGSRGIQGPILIRMNVALPQPAAQRDIQLALGGSHWLARGKFSSCWTG